MCSVGGSAPASTIASPVSSSRRACVFIDSVWPARSSVRSITVWNSSREAVAPPPEEFRLKRQASMPSCQVDHTKAMSARPWASALRALMK
jgi:hypothetical protein